MGTQKRDRVCVLQHWCSVTVLHRRAAVVDALGRIQVLEGKMQLQLACFRNEEAPWDSLRSHVATKLWE